MATWLLSPVLGMSPTRTSKQHEQTKLTHLHTEGEAGSRSLVPCSWWKHSQRANSQHYSCRIQMLRRGKCRKCCLRASRWWYLEEKDTSQLESQGETNDSVEMRILVDFQRTAKALYLYSLVCFLLFFLPSLSNWFCNPITPPGFGNMCKLSWSYHPLSSKGLRFSLYLVFFFRTTIIFF